MIRYVAFATLAVAVAAACGGSSTTVVKVGGGGDAGDSDGAVNVDSGAPLSQDAGSDAQSPLDPTYPTAHPALPLVDYNGGPILAAVRIVTVTFTGEDPTVQQTMQDFGDQIATTPWWDAVTENGQGYCAKTGTTTGPCVGHGMALQNGNPHVVLTETPAATYTDSSSPTGGSTLQAMIQSLVADSELPAPEPDILYAIYFPSTTSITLDGEPSCQAFGAYHNSTTVMAPGATSATEVAYAIMPRCDNNIDDLTLSASHEYIEAATDPYVGAGLAYYMNDVAWAGTTRGGEVGDLCETGNSATTQGSWTVQRSWSNASAKASHDPCVPIPAGEVYFNVAPTTDSLIIGLGQTKTIDLVGFSDAAMADWTISTVDHASFTGGTQGLSFVLSQTDGYNGAKFTLAITVGAALSQGEEAFSISSKSGSSRHSWSLLVTQQLN